MIDKLMIIVPYFADTQIRHNNAINLIETFNELKIPFVIANASADKFCFNQRNVNEIVIPRLGAYMNKSAAINRAVALCNYPIMAWHDVDVRFTQSTYRIAYNRLAHDEINFFRPFNGTFKNVRNYNYTRSLEENIFYDDVLYETLHKNSPGGCVFFNRKKFIQIGGMNENFCGWGFEDDEFRYRIEMFDELHSFSKSICYHLDHPRWSIHQSSNPQYLANEQEFQRILSLTKEELVKDKFSIFR